MSLKSLILSVRLAAYIIGLGGSTSAWGENIERLSISDLQRRITEIDSELGGLSRFSLNSGVGPIGYRSLSHPEAEHLEWARVDLSREAEIDEIVLVPTLWRDLNTGFVSDAFPGSLRIIAGTADNPTGTVVAEFCDTSHLLPRIAPLVVPTGGIRASWVKIEVDRLSRRAFDGKYIFQLAELLVFADQENLALHRPVSISFNNAVSPAWNQKFLVDGILPYVMNSGRGDQSIAFISSIGIGDQPSIVIDLQQEHPISGIRLHAVDQSDTVPQIYAGDFALPRRFRIEGSNDANFTAAHLLMEASPTTIYELGPIMEWNFQETDCRYLRLTAIDPYVFEESGKHGTRIGYAEIEVLADGRNVAVGQQASAAFNPARTKHFAALTDGHNLYGRILPVRQWLGELARRHDLETARPLLAAKLSEKHAHQRTILNWMFWLAALLVGGIAFILFYNHFLALHREANIRERIAANLHDELGANLHAIGLLGDLAKDSVDSREDLVDTLDRIRSLTERTGSAARNCAEMIIAKGICEDLVADMRNDCRRLLADLKHSITVEGKENLSRLPRSKRIDLYLFHKEALINIIRHSGATEATTRLVAKPGEIELTISDNGCGITGEPPSSIKRRARLLGADLILESPEAGGTRIILKLKPRKFLHPQMNDPIKVMLVEDNSEFRKVLRLAFLRDGGIELSSEFGTAEIALRSLRDGAIPSSPQVILLDLRLPGMQGLDALPHFTSTAPLAKVIVLTQSDCEADVLRAIALGAAGYLLKSSTTTQIKEGIRTVIEGGASLDPRVARFLLKNLQARLPKNSTEATLSERELEVLTLLGEGLVKKEIADRLGITYPTVDSHVQHIYEKLQVHNAPAAINIAHRLGLFPPKP